ncbi:putative lipoprotein [Bacillus thuringiensis MC28]|nr:putative lipoprotein [Bacillus thuringiensis MC28]
MRQNASLFFLGDGQMRFFLRNLSFLLFFVLLLVGCQPQENNIEQKPTTKKTEEKVQITKEEEQSIQDVIEAFVRTTNERKFAEHMELFSKKLPSAEDLKTQKEAAFQKGNKKIELEHIDMKASKAGYIIVETKEKELDGEIAIQKKVQYALGKEDETWKIEEVRTIEKK